MKALSVISSTLIIVLIPLALFAQEYVEASGQTNVFELKAGAKAGWNASGSGIFYTSKVDKIRLMNVRLHAGRNAFSIFNKYENTSALSFELFSINGVRIIRTPISGQSSVVVLKSPLLPGYYLARMKHNGLTFHTSTFFVSR